MLFTSQKPQDDLSGFITVREGNYGIQQVEGALNVPLVADKVLLRVAGYYQTRDGYQYNEYLQSRSGDIGRYGARPSLTVNFTDHVKDTLTVDYAHLTGAGTAPVLYSLDSRAPAIPVTALYAGGVVSDATFTALALAAGAPPGTSLSGAWAEPYFEGRLDGIRGREKRLQSSLLRGWDRDDPVIPG